LFAFLLAQFSYIIPRVFKIVLAQFCLCRGHFASCASGSESQLCQIVCAVVGTNVIHAIGCSFLLFNVVVKFGAKFTDFNDY